MELLLKTKMNAEFVEKITEKIVAVNKEIHRDEMRRGMGIGHSYFCDYDSSQSPEEWWHDIMEYKVLPYLEEICFDEEDQLEKMKEILLG